MTAHDLFSRFVGIPLADWQRACIPSERSRMLSKRRALQFRYQAESWPAAEKERWILERLRHVVRNAARETTYYGSLFRKIGFNYDADFGFEEFSKLPVLDKIDIAN